jgi:hypothetical protein
MFVENDEEHKNVRNYQETIFLFTSWFMNACVSIYINHTNLDEYKSIKEKRLWH